MSAGGYAVGSGAAASPFSVARKSPLDLVFIVDNTGSMSSYLEAAKKTVTAIANNLARSGTFSEVRFAAVFYNDFDTRSESLDGVIEAVDFVISDRVEADVLPLLNRQTAHGGADIPEALAMGMGHALGLNWNQDLQTVKVAVIITDAPPHGLCEQGDNFPSGDRQYDTKDKNLLTVSNEFIRQGIAPYIIAGGESVARCAYALDYFIALAEVGGGRVFSISSAAADAKPENVAKTIEASATRTCELAVLEASLDVLVNTCYEEQADGADFTWENIDKRIAQKLNEPNDRNCFAPAFDGRVTTVAAEQDGTLQELPTPFIIDSRTGVEFFRSLLLDPNDYFKSLTVELYQTGKIREAPKGVAEHAWPKSVGHRLLPNQRELEGKDVQELRTAVTEEHVREVRLKLYNKAIATFADEEQWGHKIIRPSKYAQAAPTA